MQFDIFGYFIYFNKINDKPPFMIQLDSLVIKINDKPTFMITYVQRNLVTLQENILSDGC